MLESSPGKLFNSLFCFFVCIFICMVWKLKIFLITWHSSKKVFDGSTPWNYHFFSIQSFYYILLLYGLESIFFSFTSFYSKSRCWNRSLEDLLFYLFGLGDRVIKGGEKNVFLVAFFYQLFIYKRINFTGVEVGRGGISKWTSFISKT